MNRVFGAIAICAVVLAPQFPVEAGTVVYEEGEKKVEIGGRIQLQYFRDDPDDGEATDEILFRRLRPYIAGTVTKDWYGKIQVEFGKAGDDDEVAIKDAYLRYDGAGVANLRVTIGNAKAPFSREYATSSKRLQFVERGFAGDHNYGSPDRQTGVRVDGKTYGEKLTFAAALGMQQHDPDARRMDFDSPVNGKSDWNDGVVLVGRLDYHPLGEAKPDRGDFDRGPSKLTFGVAGFSWANDDDNNTYTDEAGRVTVDGIDRQRIDLDHAQGVELVAAYRGHGVSADVELQRVRGEAVDDGFDGGVYRDGEADLDIVTANAGYMVLPARLELAVGWDRLDADAYTDAWTRTSAGVNLYWNRHKAKLQVSYRAGRSIFGVEGRDGDELYVQTQFVF